MPGLASWRILLGLGLLLVMAGLTWFGHGGRLVFAVMTLLFVASAAGVLVHGFVVGSHGHARVTGPEGSAVVAVLLSFPVATALATGTEAPAAAIGQLRATDRRRFARATIVLTMAIVTVLTIGITALAVRLTIGIPPADSTPIADTARAAAGNGALIALFRPAARCCCSGPQARPSRPDPDCPRRSRGTQTVPALSASVRPTTPSSARCQELLATVGWRNLRDAGVFWYGVLECISRVLG